MRYGYHLAGVICFAAAGFTLLGMSMADERPTTLSLTYGSHVAVPAVNRMILNGREIVSRSLKGRNESGPIEYLDGQGDALNFEVAWYDILNRQAYAAKFTVPASELTTLESLPYMATIDIINGPGADITVTTMNKEIAKLIGKDADRRLPSLDEAPDIVLREICAEALPPADSVAMELANAAVDPNEQEQLGYNLRSRDSYLSQHQMPVSRCAEKGTN